MTSLIKYKKSFMSTSIKDFKNSIIDDISSAYSILPLIESYSEKNYFGLLITLQNNKSHLVIIKKSNKTEFLKYLNSYFEIYQDFLIYEDKEDVDIAKEQLESIFSSCYALVEDDFELSAKDLQNFKSLKFTPIKSLFNF